MSCRNRLKVHQEPYTKYPNRYNDVIKPQLTDTQRDICDLVIRMTYGWHQTSAEISNPTFAKKARKSIQGVINAKKQLEDMGLLVVLEKGGGSRKSRYMLDLYYNDPGKSVKASLLRQEEQLQELKNSSPAEEQEGILQILEAPVADEPAEPQPKRENPAAELELEAPVAEDSIEESGISLEEDQAPVEEVSGSISPTPEAEISDSEKGINPVGIEAHELPGTKLSLPPSEEDINNIPGEERKQTVHPKGEKLEKRKKAAATVRYEFLSVFPDAGEDDDWAFFGWAARAYGVETCLGKLSYMREHRKRYSIANPKGFFRMALVKDYQIPAFIAARVRADERAKREAERFRRESQEWDRMVVGYNYESASAACQRILDMLG